MYGTLVYCTLFGLMVVAISPNLMIAAVVSAAFYSMWNLFAGFILPRPVSALCNPLRLASQQAKILLHDAPSDEPQQWCRRNLQCGSGSLLLARSLAVLMSEQP